MSSEEPKDFAEFVEHWKNQGYEVHITKKVLEDLENIYAFTFWDLPPLPFEIAEDVLHKLPRNRFTRWLSSWIATLAIYANRPLFKRLTSRKNIQQRTYRIA